MATELKTAVSNSSAAGRAVKLCVAGFWAVMIALLLNREIFSGEAQRKDIGYRAALAHRLVERTDRFRLLLGKREVGITETQIARARDGGFTITNHTQIETPALDILGRETTASLFAVANVGGDFALRNFQASLRSPVYNVRITGRPEGEELVLTVTFHGNTVEERIPFDRRLITAVLFSPFATMPVLKEGMKWPVQIMNPLSQRFEVGWAEVGGVEKFNWNGTPVETRCVNLQIEGLGTFMAWVTKDGVVLKETGILGLVLVREGVGE